MSEQYFAADPKAAERRRVVSFQAYGRAYRMTTSTAVFSGDRLDPGTAVLFRGATLPERAGTFLDLGCGYGPVACVLATAVPGSTVWAVDVNRRALELTRANAADAGLEADTGLAGGRGAEGGGRGVEGGGRGVEGGGSWAEGGGGSVVRTATPDEVPAEAVFDQIWSNPPIRIGKAALHGLLDRWLPRLAPDGMAWLVVGRNLGADSLQGWLGSRGWPTERYAGANGFRVLRVTRTEC